MTKKEQILSSFLRTKMNIPKDVKYEFVDFDNRRALKVYTDVAKTDKNSGQYDEEYTKFFRPSIMMSSLIMITYQILMIKLKTQLRELTTPIQNLVGIETAILN